MVNVSDFPSLFFNKLGFHSDFIYNNRGDRNSNVWILWRRNLNTPVAISESEQHVTIAMNWGLQQIHISFIHASCFRVDRRMLWLDLMHDSPQPPTPWAIIGDFNATLYSHEKRGPGSFSLGSAAEYGAMVDACSMSQIPSTGRKFTWSNNRRRGNVCAVLDRSFCNEEWITCFQDCSQLVLPRIASDHTPLVLISNTNQRPHNCPFRFHQFWMDHGDFEQVVAESWAEWVSGSSILALMLKLKRLKGVLSCWAKSTFPNFERALEEAKQQLVQVQDQIDGNGMNDQLFALEADAKMGLAKALKNHEKIWAEKARIRSIPTLDHLDLLESIPKTLQEIDNFWLDSLPGDAEIRTAMWELDPDSSPSPDGFSGAFFRRCWSIVDREVCNAVRFFFRKKYMPPGVNNNFLVLIPKMEGAETLDKFRPLCMGNFFYKIISKVMALHLEPLLPRLILEEQGAFQKGKMIHDNISVASELANLMFSSTKGGGLGLKIDISKAYDTISWSFLFQVMRRFGFFEIWIKRLHQILSSTKISVLDNGGPQGFFGVERGLRQGDPISPMLFIIAEEVLSRGLSRLVQSKMIQSIQGPRGTPTPGHILFADDIFIFSNANLRYVRNLKDFLMNYQEFFGQCINLEKSKLFLGKVAPDRRQTISETLEIPICSFPTRYLGVKIFKGRVKKEALMPVMDRVKGHLAGWKGKLLSMAARIELVRSVVSAIPNHSFAVYWWPSSLLETMERWMRNFIWTGEVDSSKAITVRWDFVCKPKEEGGLGIRRLRDTNMAMLSKMVCHFKHGKHAASSFLRARFVKKNGAHNMDCRHSSISLGIRKVWKFVDLNERWIIGNGGLARFWKDKWWGPKAIMDEIQDADISLLDSDAKLPISGGNVTEDDMRAQLGMKLGLSVENQKDTPPLEVHWCKPPINWIKINVDGSSLGNPGRAGAEGISRDSEGRVCNSFSSFLGIKKTYEAEFEAVLEGITLAQNMNVRESTPWKITHCYREVNTAADYLAKKASKSGVSACAVPLPNHINVDLEDDVLALAKKKAETSNMHQSINDDSLMETSNKKIKDEALYNIARACHHVGLVTLAVSYYEKVLAIREKDYPIPKLPNEESSLTEIQKPGYCDLRREAAYNLHLIYKQSGAFDLARQVLKDHCTL
ncbi:uncharacterized protein LOC122074317 [Macadamia integrifolia]|uniref:uncharacterized protein LOC122074317 n=1 Tax=Macadamia integrifolia TaxID=60698 RepID=UPI001C500E82|nr:uncharacterized protein LOC122074317 [Macadamia integrifolia]